MSLGSAWTTKSGSAWAMMRPYFTNPLKWRQAPVEDLPIFAMRTEEMRLHARGKTTSEHEALGFQGCVKRAGREARA